MMTVKENQLELVRTVRQWRVKSSDLGFHLYTHHWPQVFDLEGVGTFYEASTEVEHKEIASKTYKNENGDEIVILNA